MRKAEVRRIALSLYDRVAEYEARTVRFEPQHVRLRYYSDGRLSHHPPWAGPFTFDMLVAYLEQSWRITQDEVAAANHVRNYG